MKVLLMGGHSDGKIVNVDEDAKQVQMGWSDGSVELISAQNGMDRYLVWKVTLFKLVVMVGVLEGDNHIREARQHLLSEAAWKVTVDDS